MGLNQLAKERNIDIVMCIDATSSMGPCIDHVRRNAKQFYNDFVNVMTTQYNSDVSSVRVQVIVFRDLECDMEAMIKSEFFELPEDDDLFERFLNNIQPLGGGDYKESGLEALYEAMTTDWIARSTNDRQVILLFTDSDAIGFTEKRNRPGYPNTFDEGQFLSAWMCKLGNRNKLSERCKRLVMFAPAKSIYEDKLQKSMNRSQFRPVMPMKGMSDIAFDEVIKILCASASAV
jgi:hypothetical protein